jgi:hypothetical protein
MLMKKLLPALAAVLCLIANARAVPAQDWPQQPIHLIVSFGPGGGADIIGRILADAMEDRLGKPWRSVELSTVLTFMLQPCRISAQSPGRQRLPSALPAAAARRRVCLY